MPTTHTGFTAPSDKQQGIGAAEPFGTCPNTTVTELPKSQKLSQQYPHEKLLSAARFPAALKPSFMLLQCLPEMRGPANTQSVPDCYKSSPK